MCVDRGRDAIHGCSVVVLTVEAGFEAAAGRFHTVVVTTHGTGAVSSAVCVFKKTYIYIYFIRVKRRECGYKAVMWS